jgi:hypothetical protein
MYLWTTFGISELLRSIWKSTSIKMVEKIVPQPHLLEFTSALERALAYAMSGNARVLSKGVMEPLWISRALLDVGMPMIRRVYNYGTDITLSDPVTILTSCWPLDKRGKYPAIASKYTHIINYGQDHYLVCW